MVNNNENENISKNTELLKELDNEIETLDDEETNESTNKNLDQKRKKKKKRVGKIIFNIITIILFVVVILEAAVGIINMSRINNGEKPIWYLNKEEVQTELKTEVKYNLGLYKIIKTDTKNGSKTTLKPFFLAD